MTEILRRSCAAFAGDRRLAAGPLAEVALVVRAAAAENAAQNATQNATGGAATPILVLDTATGRVIDLDLRGSDEEVLARLPALTAAFPEAADDDAAQDPNRPRGRGRPKLGVTAREVTLLPRHWAWLAAQPGGASVALRKLVEHARREGAEAEAARRRREAVYRAMSALAGDRPGFEAAARALFADDAAGLRAAMAPWPREVADHLLGLAFPP